MKENIEKEQKEFLKKAFDNNCITTSYGGEILIAQNKTGLKGTFYSIYSNGKPRETAFVSWEQK